MQQSRAAHRVWLSGEVTSCFSSSMAQEVSAPAPFSARYTGPSMPYLGTKTMKPLVRT